MESQRIVYMEESHKCPDCEKLICRVTRGSGKKHHIGCECEDDNTEPDPSLPVKEGP